MDNNTTLLGIMRDQFIFWGLLFFWVCFMPAMTWPDLTCALVWAWAYRAHVFVFKGHYGLDFMCNILYGWDASIP